MGSCRGSAGFYQAFYAAAKTYRTKTSWPQLRVQVSGFGATWRGRGLSKFVISRVIIRANPFRALMTLLITYLVSPLPFQVNPKP